MHYLRIRKKEKGTLPNGTTLSKTLVRLYRIEEGLRASQRL